MKCKKKDCENCVHYINIRTHPLFNDFIIKGEDGKIVEFEGCIFHLQTMFLRQIWVRLIGNEAAIESTRNILSKDLNILSSGLMRAAKGIEDGVRTTKELT